MTEDVGLPREYFHRRFAAAMRAVVERGITQRSPQPIMAAIKVSVHESLYRLKFCPVCGTPLKNNANFPLERSCECGDFMITDVWTSGEVVFEFTMNAAEEIVDAEPTDEDDDPS